MCYAYRPKKVRGRCAGAESINRPLHPTSPRSAKTRRSPPVPAHRPHTTRSRYVIWRRLPYQKPHTMAMPFAHLDQHDLPRARPWSATRPRSGFAASASALTEQGGAVCAARPIRLNTRLPPVRSGSRRFELNHPVPNPTGVKRGCHAHCIRRQAAINCFRAV